MHISALLITPVVLTYGFAYCLCRIADKPTPKIGHK